MSYTNVRMERTYNEYRQGTWVMDGKKVIKDWWGVLQGKTFLHRQGTEKDTKSPTLAL